MSSSKHRFVNSYLFRCLCLVITLITVCNTTKSMSQSEKSDSKIKYFPQDFMFGVSTSAYQIEGSQNEKGAGKTSWDYFRKKHPEYFNESGKNDTKFCDAVNKWRSDVEALKFMGVNFYRFSISWARILPTGFPNEINQEGVKYYNDLINELLNYGIQPMVTMYHFDLPLVLQNIGGWTNPYMAKYFEDYARTLFNLFGDRVKYWITMNAACPGYGYLTAPPFLTEPAMITYLCVHVAILTHAKVYHLYKNEFKSKQNGMIGFVMDGKWYEPKTKSTKDIEAAERARIFMNGVYLNPIFHPEGNYPKKVIERVEQISKQEGFLSSKLPSFTSEEIDYIKGSYDFLGLNVYTTYLVEEYADPTLKPSFDKDLSVRLSQPDEWPRTGSKWLREYPKGMRRVLNWVRYTYGDFPIYITENGYSDAAGIREDIERVSFLQGYLESLLDAILEDKIQVKGYAIWSLLDNFEWTSGFSEKFGVYSVDFDDPNRSRSAKLSAQWYSLVIKHKRALNISDFSTST